MMASEESLLTALCSNSELLHRVIGFLFLKHQRNLRLTDRRLREAVSAAVVKVTFSLHDRSLRSDLASVFPRATRLLLRLHPRCDDDRAVTPTDMCMFLQHMAASSPVLLQRLHHLTLDVILDGGLSISAHHAICSLLDKCTSLRSLNVHWLDHAAYQEDELSNILHFVGQGSTPASRLASLQQQLRSLASESVLFAPTTWPLNHCLVHLDLGNRLGPEFRAMCRHAVATTSLASLKLFSTQPNELRECAGLSQLTRLTKLFLSGSTGFSSQQLQALAAEVACLTALKSLLTDSNLLRDGVSSSVPSSWSQLTNLTYLSLVNCNLHLTSLSSLGSVRQLVLVNCDLQGGLRQLAALTALTYLDALSSDSEDDGTGAAGLPGGSLAAERPLRGLKELFWRFSQRDMHTISQLTALTKLGLRSAEIKPELWWQLTPLTRLRDLGLPSALAPEQPASFLSTSFRPALLTLQHVHPCDHLCLRELAHWTQVGPHLALPRRSLSARVPLSFTELGAGWLRAVVAAPRASVALYVRDDDALGALLKALEPLGAGGRKRLRLALLLGEAVGPEALGRLFAAAHLFPEAAIRIANGRGDIRQDKHPAWPFHEELPQMHYSYLSGATATQLRVVHIDACPSMLDWHLAQIVAAAPGLAQLWLERAEALTDAALYALLGCQQLRDVSIFGCAEFGAPAVAMLLSSLRGLRQAKVGQADPDAVAYAVAMLASTSGKAGAGSRRWSVQLYCHYSPADGVLCQLLP